MSLTRAQQYGAVDLSAFQPLSTDLTAISGLAPSNDDIIQRKAGVWTNRTVAQYALDLSPARTAFTPTLTQSGAVTKTTTYAKYIQIGKLVIVNYDLLVTGGAGVANNGVLLGLPVTAATAGNLTCGTGWIYDSSANQFFGGILRITSTTTMLFNATTGTSPNQLGATGAAFTAALAVNDQIGASIFYEAA